MPRGKFITFEGVDGAGKSTHIEPLAALLRGAARSVVVTREPGGTPLGEALRKLLLAEPMDPDTETLLMFAARSEHLARVIHPALARGDWVLCDRFTDATFAYQCGGRGVARERVQQLADWVHPGFGPDVTLLFDLPLDIARQRLAATGAPADKFEREGAAFFQGVRDEYWRRARAEPNRFVIIDANKSQDDIYNELEIILLSL